MVVHDALDEMFKRFPESWPENAPVILRHSFADALAKAKMRPALVAWWSPRLMRIADWVVSMEGERRERGTARYCHTEVTASFELNVPAGPFRIRGRADRIDIDDDGKATIFDYKTGQPPTGADVERGWSAQLVIEAALLAVGAFEDMPVAETRAMLYWHLTGGRDPGREQEVPSSRSKTDAATLIGEALERLRQLVEDYDDPERPYRSQPWAGRVPRFADYAQLARVEEWRAAYSEDGE